MAFHKFWSSFKPTGSVTNYVGRDGDVILDADSDTIRIMDGTTPGGVIFNPSSQGSQVNTVTSVTAASYTIAADDYYIGVNYAGVCTVTLGTATEGRVIIVKDESGSAGTNNIVLLGTIDNDAGGATIAIDNGSLTLIYNNGWRVI